MGELREVLRTWAAEMFDAPEFQDDPSGLRSSFGFPFQDEEVDLGVFVDIDDEVHRLAVFAYVKLTIPEDRRGDVATLTALVNPRFRIGSFELIDDGKLRFRVAFDLEDTIPSTKVIGNLIGIAAGACTSLMPPLVAVVSGGMSAANALEATTDRPDEDEGAERSLPAAKWLDERVPPRDWASFRGVAPVRDWAVGLRTTPADDELAARGVIFVGPDIEACQSVARLAAAEAGYRFAFIPRDQIDTQTASTLASLRALAPVVVFLQAGAWSLPPNSPDLDPETREKTKAFQALLLQAFKARDPAKPVVFATSHATLRHLGLELASVGAFDLAFAVPEPSPRAKGEAFLDAVGQALCGETLLAHPGKVGKALALAFGSVEARNLARLHLQRLAARERRKVEFIDLVEIYTRGFVEAAPVDDAPEPMREHVAVHEAGHAAMAVLDSGGFDVPDFATIIPSVESRGVVVSSLSHRHDTGERMTYEDFRHSVRVSLAGRAAEELTYGPQQVANGASSDLEGATRLAFHAFTQWGFSPGMETIEASRSNLAVVVDPPAESEVAHNIALVRQFLADEYARVFDVLRQHRGFLETVRDRLLVDPVVDRAELVELCERHGVPAQPGE